MYKHRLKHIKRYLDLKKACLDFEKHIEQAYLDEHWEEAYMDTLTWGRERLPQYRSAHLASFSPRVWKLIAENRKDQQV